MSANNAPLATGHAVRRIFQLALLPAVLVALWWVTSEIGDNFFFPPLSRILAEFPGTWFSGRIATDVIPSILRLLAGYAAALLLGVSLGLAIGISPTLRALLDPLLAFARAVPPPVLVPILMLFLGLYDPMKIAVIASGCVWPILLNTVEGVRGTDEVQLDTSRVYGFRRLATLRLLLRSSSPQIVAGARQSLSIGIVLMVISEMFAASNGIGYAIITFQRNFDIPEMWSGIILLGFVGVALSLAFQVIERAVLRWYHGFRRADKQGQ